MDKDSKVTSVTIPTKNVLKDGQVTIWMESVGPETAEKYLSTYKTDYRKFRPTFAEGLARDMINGKWIFAADPIKIDVNGNLQDGQHRLKSIILSGTRQKFLFVHGLPIEAYAVTDMGLSRRYSDLLRSRGYRNVHNRASVIKLISRWERGVNMDDTRRLTNAEHDDINDRYVDTINRALEVILSTRSRIDMRLSVALFAFWLLSGIDKEHAFTFFIQLAEGENIRRGMPVYALRDRLHRDKEEKHTITEYLYMVFSAWNAYMEGRDLEKIYVPNNVQRFQLPTLVTEFHGVEVEDENELEEDDSVEGEDAYL